MFTEMQKIAARTKSRTDVIRKNFNFFIFTQKKIAGSLARNVPESPAMENYLFSATLACKKSKHGRD